MAKHDKYTEKNLKKIGARIKQLRKEKGFTNYEQFAYTHQISRAQYGRYEKGSDMRLSSFIKVLKALDVSWVDFFSEGFDNSESKEATSD